MKRLNNKGYMLIEIIIASFISLVIAYFLIDITIKLVNKNNDYYVTSELLSDKNIITKEIMDDINSKKLTKVIVNEQHTSATLTYDDNTIKELIIDKENKKIEYGDYVKKISDKLNLSEIKLEIVDNEILTISIPAYTNYSKENYGIKITIPYTENVEVSYPKPPTVCENNNNPPKLTNGLIPVTYNGTTWVTADVTNLNDDWYNYCEKKWANAVLVNNTLRNSLRKNADGTYEKGQKIGDSESDGVLAFYVWIPRYKYKVWNINKIVGIDTYDAQNKGVDIIFENGTETTGGISCTYNYNVDPENGGIDLNTTTAETCSDRGTEGYYTHPAFTFYNKEITGLWFGKFEVSSTTSRTNVRILPNVASWDELSNTAVVQIYYAQKMQKSNNEYGLPTSYSIADSHLTTNMKWGAVAYLSHSIYGRCEDDGCQKISLNKNENFLTGYAGETYEYTTTEGQKASTTGNIYGIYDMSGGRPEEVMANSSCSKTKYEFCASRSGWQNDGYFDTIAEYGKYLTTYAYISSYKGQNAYNAARLGDATAEIMTDLYPTGYGWQNGLTKFMYGDNMYYPWLERGGRSSGLFSFNYCGGGRGTTYNGGSRFSLVVFP